MARSGAQTLKGVEHQVESACLGIAQTVQNQQSGTGTKDAYTQFWIDDLIARARTLRHSHPERTAANIQAELLAWVRINRDGVYNAFLTLDGGCLAGQICGLTNSIIDRIRSCH